MAVKIYDPGNVTLIVGVVPISGFAAGEFINVEHVAPNFTDVVGVDGEVARLKHQDRRATIRINLMQSAASNDYLSALANIDLATPTGAAIVPFLCIDTSGRTILAAEKCWIVQQPNVSYDKEATAREWEIRCAYLVETQGGSGLNPLLF